MSVYGTGGAVKVYNKPEVARKLPYLPWKIQLKNGKECELDMMDVDNEKELSQCMRLFNDMLEDGRYWPFEESSFNKSQYLNYYCSHAPFVLRDCSDNSVLGTFYVKPNFPGRSSHICNGGFITDRKLRGFGIATTMGKAYLRIGKDLGYKGSLFNLVFESNQPSIKIWEKLGFVHIGTIPNAADLKGIDGLDDARLYYYDLTKYKYDKSVFETKKIASKL